MSSPTTATSRMRRRRSRLVKLTSNATDKADGDKVFDANARGVTIVDTVSYANLVPGEQYVLKGALMDRETGCALNAGRRSRKRRSAVRAAGNLRIGRCRIRLRRERTVEPGSSPSRRSSMTAT